MVGLPVGEIVLETLGTGVFCGKPGEGWDVGLPVTTVSWLDGTGVV